MPPGVVKLTPFRHYGGYSMPESSLFSHAFDVLHNRLVIRGKLLALTALRIGAGRSTETLGNDLPVLRDASNRPFIPGASLKGVFRARLEALIRAVAPNQALDLPSIEKRTSQLRSKKETESWTTEKFEEEIWKGATLIDLTFGSPEIAGRLFFRDALIDPALWFDRFEVRNGVAINRDSETVEGSQLYDYEVVPAGMRFEFELTLENAAPWQLGMVLLALRPWQNEGVQLGGFRSRGLGYVKLEEVEMHYYEIAPGDVDALLQMICDAKTLAELEIAPTPTTVSEGQRQAWFQAFRTELTRQAQHHAEADHA